ncbi:membrane-bound lytic murein transglycosylase MltF [Zooshikella ganghwensis]|uniref:Membrane-bound lytic murein transglycosylase F n=1 Tax=Zooshikella ganghwensis TaxID=202772 RepID=A0A4P9VM98_9GAMM|nr:membrane-bound lytic murein transglycosylase MltF [Zooshikella ganghwensis]RDH43032.1 membrane-bound lytic murein transglycosylase MltF [Zooshikella ganghwensis]
MVQQYWFWLTYYQRWSRELLILPVVLLLAACEQPVSTLDQIKQSNTLWVITRNSPTTYFQWRDQPTGFEYELARLFAKDLGVELKLVTANSLQDIFASISSGPHEHRFHIAAAGLSITKERQQRVRFGPPYMNVNLSLIYNTSQSRPTSLADLVGKRVMVMADSSHEERLQEASETLNLTWESTTEHEAMDLIKMVNDGEIDYSIVDSNVLAMNYIYFPKVRSAFDLQPSEQLAWALSPNTDAEFVARITQFFEKIRKNGTLDQLNERFYGHVDQLNYVGVKTFIQQTHKRLPKHEKQFKRVAKKYEMDWRLLAAIGYQESHWRARAKSPTGVRGLMMLTRPTAKEVGVKNRLDPQQSIRGGAKYFQKIKKRLPEEIKEPDRTWMALAAYNVGFGHLQDAREITRKLGGNANKWVDVKKSLPLLAKKQWFSQTRYGYARGYEPVLYVQNIRRYYDLLQWLTVPKDETSTTIQAAHSPGIYEPDKASSIKVN